jgi:hypothetical protein
MDRSDAEIEWILTERVTGEANDATVMVRARDGQTCAMTYHCEPGAANGVLRFDGRYVDVGADLMAYLSVMDEITETGTSEPYQDAQ